MSPAEELNNLFLAFKIRAICRNHLEYKGLSSFDIELKPGARIRDVEKYLDEISLALRFSGKPTLKILGQEGILRLEIANQCNNAVNLFSLGYNLPRPAGKLTCLLGETYEGNPLWIDLINNPHMLIAGASGSGKSTLLHALIANLLLHPKTSIVLMDPKNIEFYRYAEMRMDRVQVLYDYQECLGKMEELCQEMEERYRLIREHGIALATFPYIVLIIDEFADLMQQDFDKKLSLALCRLAQKSRAAGIHLIISTQRPSVDVIDGIIKANFPARISCKVSSGVDSRVILDANGAQHLMGKGDALLKNSQFDMERFQVAFTSPEEIGMYFGSA